MRIVARLAALATPVLFMGWKSMPMDEDRLGPATAEPLGVKATTAMDEVPVDGTGCSERRGNWLAVGACTEKTGVVAAGVGAEEEKREGISFSS